MDNAFPLSKDSMAAMVAECSSMRSASLVSSLPRLVGVVVFHTPCKALRAATTAISTSDLVSLWRGALGTMRHTFWASFVNRADGLLVCGVNDLKGLAFLPLDKFAVNK